MSARWSCPGRAPAERAGAGSDGPATATIDPLARTRAPGEAPNRYTVMASGEYHALPNCWSADVLRVLNTTLVLIRDDADQLIEVQPVADFAEGRRYLQNVALGLAPARGHA